MRWNGRAARSLVLVVVLGALPPVPGGVVAPFSPPEHRYAAGHRGVDLAASPGEEVRAALAGTVAFAGRVAGRGWVAVDHGRGLSTTYGQLGVLAVVRGQRVAAGEVLGSLAAERDHLDWGARLAGEYVDPLTLLLGWRAHLIPADRFVPRFAPMTQVPPGLAPPRDIGARDRAAPPDLAPPPTRRPP